MYVKSAGTDLMPNGGDLLDDHTTPGYSRLTTAHWEASDSPGELPKIADIEGRRYGPPLPMRYDDDDEYAAFMHRSLCRTAPQYIPTSVPHMRSHSTTHSLYPRQWRQREFKVGGVEPCEPTVRLSDWSGLVASYSRMESAWGWANGRQPILVCYIRKYVIILGDIPVDVPKQNLAGCVPGIPGGVDTSDPRAHNHAPWQHSRVWGEECKEHCWKHVLTSICLFKKLLSYCAIRTKPVKIEQRTYWRKINILIVEFILVNYRQMLCVKLII